MARRFLLGLVWGSLVGGAGLAGLSVMYPSGPFMGTTQPDVITQAPLSGVPADEEVALTLDAPAGSMTETATPSALAAPESTEPPSQTNPVMQPEVGAVAEVSPDVVTEGEGADLTMAASGTEPSIADITSSPETPDGEVLPEIALQPDMPDAQTESIDAGTPPEGGEGVASTMPADTTPSGTAPEATSVPDANGETAPDSQTPPAPQPAPIPRVTQPDAGGGTPGVTAGQIGDLAEGVTTNRLPSIGGDTETISDNTPVAVGTSALQRNAQSFENGEGHPTMAVLLVDMGAERAQLGDLKNLPFPMSFIVSADAADAAEAIAFYRSAGAEIVVAVPFPQGATPSDVEVTLSAYAPLLEDAVAIMAPRESGFQSLGSAATQVAVILNDTGHGLISIPQGLNTGHKLAQKEGVPVGQIFRELDNDGQSGSVIRRFMDNAAFKARQNQGVIMLGHAQVETIQALIEWSLGNRAKSVALAPVSAILQGQ